MKARVLVLAVSVAGAFPTSRVTGMFCTGVAAAAELMVIIPV